MLDGPGEILDSNYSVFKERKSGKRKNYHARNVTSVAKNSDTNEFYLDDENRHGIRMSSFNGSMIDSHLDKSDAGSLQARA